MRYPRLILVGGPSPVHETTMDEAVALINKVIKIQNADTDTPTIEIDGFIGELFWEESQNTVKAIKAKLKDISKLKATKIIVNINSPGGFVDAGLGIHDILALHKAEVETNINGLTASMATVIAQSGDTRRMSDNALMLIHQVSGGAWGNINETAEHLEDLKKINSRLINIYEKRNSISTEDEIVSLMEENNGNGIWIDAEEALKLGYIDEIFEPMQAAASVVDPKVKAMLRLPDLPQGKIPPVADEPAQKEDKLTIDIMKKELSALLATIKGLLSTKKEGATEPTIAPEAQTVIDNLQSQIDEVGNQEERVTELEGSVATITEERDTAVTDLATANTTIGTLQTELVQAKAASTKAPGKQGGEDPDKPQNPEDAALSADAASLLGRFNQTSG